MSLVPPGLTPDSLHSVPTSQTISTSGSTSAFASSPLGPQTATWSHDLRRTPASHPRGLSPESGSRGSHRPGHIHLVPPQPDHRPDMTWRRAAATGGTGSGQVTPSVGQTQSCNPSQPTPHSLGPPREANTPEQGRGLLRSHSHQASLQEAMASILTPGPWGGRPVDMQHWATGQRKAWPLRCNGPSGSLEQVGPNVVQTLSPQSDHLEPCWAQEDGEWASGQSRGRKEDCLQATDITGQRTRISTIKATVAYARLGWPGLS